MYKTTVLLHDRLCSVASLNANFLRTLKKHSNENLIQIEKNKLKELQLVMGFHNSTLLK